MNGYSEETMDQLEAADALDRATIRTARRQMNGPMTKDDARPETSDVAASFERMCEIMEGKVS